MFSSMVCFVAVAFACALATLASAGTGKAGSTGGTSTGGGSTGISTPIQVHVPYFSLTEVYYIHPFYGFKVEAKYESGKWVMPLWDGVAEKSVYFIWRVHPDFPKQQFATASRRFVLNGLFPVTNAYIQLEGDDKLHAIVHEGFDLRVGGWPRAVQVSVKTQTGKTYASAVTGIHGGAMLSYFEQMLYSTFTHERCASCHAMGDQAAILLQHHQAVPPVKAEDNGPMMPQNTLYCAGCHNFPEAADWRSPFFIQGIQLRGRSAKQICQTVLSKLPTSEELRNHVHNDPRVKWAVSSGRVPMGYPDKPLAPPASLAAWVARTNAWIDAGAPCPQ